MFRNNISVLPHRSSDYQQRMQRSLEELKQQYLTTVEKIRGRSVGRFTSLLNVTLRFWRQELELSLALSGRRRDALPPRESRASGRDDPHGGAEGAKEHGQKDALLLSELSAGVTGGRRKGHRVRRSACPSFSSKRASTLRFIVFASLCRAESKIMNAASKLAAMAKVLETPVKAKRAKNYCLQSETA